jgi:deoxyadenosine/deoxycytidine kinase/NTP pyrophosphatase (non-canonical NTP hydrolase)
MNIQAYITVEGVIGVGKTTLARMFQKEISAQLVLEVFEENPFLSDFYTDRARYAFQTQIFFLLSRYHQQRQLAAIPRPLISDYMFEKDRLFAQVNLAGDEFKTYVSVHEALAENVPVPNLVVFLKADTSTLLNRITARDRPYERNMDPDYIDSLRAAYEQFFASYQRAPVLTIDTNEIDFVQHPEDREEIFNRIRGALGQGPLQPSLPGMDQPAPSGVISLGAPVPPDQTARRLSDFQQFHRQLDQNKQFQTDLYLNFMLLQEEMGKLAGALVQQRAAGHSDSSLAAIREELADVLAYVIKLANYTGIDLEDAYLEKMQAEGESS